MNLLSVLWQVQIRVRDGKKVEHQGIKIEWVGHIGKCQDIAIPVSLELT